jgi:hypothetical protein
MHSLSFLFLKSRDLYRVKAGREDSGMISSAGAQQAFDQLSPS